MTRRAWQKGRDRVDGGEIKGGGEEREAVGIILEAN